MPIPTVKHALTSAFFALSAVLAVACSAGNAEDSRSSASSASSTDSIVGGVVAAEGAWPGTVAVFSDGEETCGGSLVAPDWVVTAGHCLDMTLPLGGLEKIIAGRNKLSGKGGEEIAIVKVVRHPDYYGPKHLNDIALLQLATPSTKPLVKLLPAEKARGVYRANTKLTVVGWGVTSATSQAASDDLLQIEVPFISQVACKKFPSYKYLQDSQFCAGLVTGGQDSCQGDSGGPIFATVNGEKVQAGIVSWGIGCAAPKAPGVYQRIADYLDWIAQTQTGASDAPDTGATDAGTEEPDAASN